MAFPGAATGSTKATVAAWHVALEARGLGAVSINVRITPTGFSSSELAAQVRALSGQSESEYSARRAAYDIKKLRGKGMAQKVSNSRRPSDSRRLARQGGFGSPPPSRHPAPARSQRQADTPPETSKPKPGRSTLRKPARHHATPVHRPWSSGVASRSTRDFTCNPCKRLGMPLKFRSCSMPTSRAGGGKWY